MIIIGKIAYHSTQAILKTGWKKPKQVSFTRWMYAINILSHWAALPIPYKTFPDRQAALNDAWSTLPVSINPPKNNLHEQSPNHWKL